LIRKAINLSIEAMKRAKTFKSRVGACLYTKNGYYVGFNVETRIHKGYHAEEMALINAMLHDVKPKDFLGIVIVYVFKGYETGIYPMCASCRQFIWEFTNPNIMVTVVNPNGKILFQDILKNLYPMPYPHHPEKRWDNDD